MDKKPTIDERLEALTHTLELMSHDTEAWREEQKLMREEQKRMDARERRGRQALLAGITAYLREVNEGSDGTQETQE